MNTAIQDDLEGRMTPERLRRLLRAICQPLGLDDRGAQLVKFTNNAVFRLAHQPVIIRIAGSAAIRARVGKVVAVARWLTDHDFPAVRLLPTVEQPVNVDGHLATVWQLVPDGGSKPTGEDLARILCHLHQLEPPPAGVLPTWRPTNAIRERLADAEGLAPADRAYLEECCKRAEDALAAVTHQLPIGPIHGDATVANLISGPAGPVICDFDSTSVGPREWDLTPVAVGQYRFSRSGNQHVALADAYGFDVTTWPDFPVLRYVRELQLVTSVVPILRSNPRLTHQFRHRLQTFRDGDTDARWDLYK